MRPSSITAGPAGAAFALALAAALAIPAAIDGQIVRGTVKDPALNAPVAEALVVMVNQAGERVATVLTSEEGGFLLEPPTGGVYMVGVARLGYQQAISPEFTVAGKDISMDILLPVDPVAIDAVTVESNRNTPDAGRLRGLLPEERRSGTLIGRLSRIEIDALSPQTDFVGLLMSMNVPGLRARRTALSVGGPANAICVENGRNRSVLRKTASAILGPGPDAPNNPLGTSLGNGCQMAAVYLNDQYLHEPGDVLAGLSPTDLETVELLPPLQALARFGGRAANGALLIWTRNGR
ncbi:MAG: carboxypeptidase-like regulatory domain-containing protein [Longimicrobiales bacterium]